MAMVVTAMCADQLMAVEGSLRPQAMMEVLEGVAGRMISEQQQQQPSPTRFAHPLRKWASQRELVQVQSLWHAHPSALDCKDLRLPPPLC